MFLGIMEKLNNNKALPGDLQSRIESYFEYKWTIDKNMAF
jgi:hypothetical protein